jgi:hypothetical protein
MLYIAAVDLTYTELYSSLVLPFFRLFSIYGVFRQNRQSQQVKTHLKTHSSVDWVLRQLLGQLLR